MKNNSLRRTAYIRFSGIDARCNNPNATNFKRYGGRGIRCLITRKEFDVWFFINAEKLGYADTFPRSVEIDRIDNNGHYEFSNMRLISKTENIRKAYREVDKIREVGLANMLRANNLRKIRVTIGDKEYSSMNEAATSLGKCRAYVKNRIRYYDSKMPDGSSIVIHDSTMIECSKLD